MGTTAKIIISFLIIVNIILASWWVINKNIFFHTDIARDFLLMEDIVENKNLTLIGPRSGAIPGLFHGPLWLYINVPSFLIGNGSPVIVGWFWVILYIVSLILTYFVGKKIFNEEVGIISALLLSATTILYAKTLFNPYGALILTPLLFYFLVNYFKKQRLKDLILSFLILGFIIQFQMAYGVPILILTTVSLIYFIYKNRKYTHTIAPLIITIPLSTHILFEVRNNFLQIKSVLNYLNGQESHGKLDFNLIQLITTRIKEMFVDGFGLITQNNISITLLVLFVVILSFVKIFKKGKDGKISYLLFTYFYLGFFCLAIFFKGPLWNYYYLPFIPLIILIFASFKNYINKWLFYIIFSLIYLVNIQVAIKDVLSYKFDPSEQDVSTWKFNELVASNIFKESEKEFGYFIFTPDLYGYSPRYAMNYYQKNHSEKKVYPYIKNQMTYLLIAPPPEYGRDPNSVWYQKNTNSNIWKNNDVRINRKPDSVISFKNGFIIEQYKLSTEELKIEPNPHLIKDIFFR